MAGVEVPGRSELVVLGLEVAGASSCQWRTVATTEVGAMAGVAGVEAVGCWESEVQLLEAAGRGNQWQRKVQAAEAGATEATRVQPEGAASLARVQSGMEGCSQCSRGSLSDTQPHSLSGLRVVIDGLSVCAAPITAGGEEHHLCGATTWLQWTAGNSVQPVTTCNGLVISN